MATRRRFIRHLEKPWENPEVIHTFEEGWKIVRCQTAWDYGLEGWFLDHCLGTKHFETFEKGHRVFSLRDPDDIPHATILCLLEEKVSPYMFCADLRDNGDWYTIEGETMCVLQVRGRNDALAKPEYLNLVSNWLRGEGCDKLTLLSAHVFGDKDDDYHIRALLSEDHDFGWWTPDSKAPNHGGIERGWLSL